MTMTSKSLTSTLMAAFFALAFSTALMLSAVGPAINAGATAAAAQTLVA
jgi:hypothetical protein